MRAIAIAGLLAMCLNTMAEPGSITLRELTETTAPDGFVEFRGVAAGPFSPAQWQAGALNLVPDHRRPLIDPKQGNARNIYAPSAVQTRDGWRVFFGGWDGVPTGNDRIYSLDASPDFRTFTNRHIIIEHGPFQHVCNVSAIETSPGVCAMVCTAYPDTRGLNKPAFFDGFARDGWSSGTTPRVAALGDIVAIAGYSPYDRCDINGMNVLLRETGVFRLYFSSFTEFGKTYRATSSDGHSYTFDGECVRAPMMVNDVKKFVAGGTPTYVMAFHRNSQELSYALSGDGLQFAKPIPLGSSLGADEKYIVAIGLVVQGADDSSDRRMLGFLYGAGARPSLDANRIFARWLQKRVVLADGTREIAGSAAIGPDAQLVPLNAECSARLRLYAEDGTALRAQSAAIHLRPGRTYAIEITNLHQ